MSNNIDIERRAIDTIRVLSMDAVEAANSGHPGMPMALAPIAHLLYSKYMKHNPADPSWPDRDRFILSAGHGSMLLYSALHLAGYPYSLDDLKNFRQWDSPTPGHPERVFGHAVTGIETTTGPLGQGFGNGVGMAMAERFLRERYGSDVVDHRIFAICSDGDIMEGITAEAASLAGHLGLGKLVYFYDDNQITIDGSADISLTEDVKKRFEAYGWQVLQVDDINNLPELSAAIESACSNEEQPSLINVRSVIAYPAPSKQGTSGSHGAPLGADEIAATKQVLGFDPEQNFAVDQEVYEYCDQKERGKQLQAEWQQRFEAWSEANKELAAEWEVVHSDHPVSGLELPIFDPQTKPKIATRNASGEVIASLAQQVPTLLGGAADLAGSVKTVLKGEDPFTKASTGRIINWGVREHAMAAAVNGMALHGGITKPFGATFLIFSDYMRPSIRLSALMKLPVIWVFSHDSLGVGEDGPTHQPIEQLASLRAIPGLTTIRPADANETTEAWRVALEQVDGPVCLVLSRQDLQVLDQTHYTPASELAKGAYLLSAASEPKAVLVATGSEVELALQAQEQLGNEGVAVNVVSMPSWELFEAQPEQYQKEVLPPNLPKISIEAGVSQGWSRWVDSSVAVDRFGASAPGDAVLSNYGFNSDDVAQVVKRLLDA